MTETKLKEKVKLLRAETNYLRKGKIKFSKNEQFQQREEELNGEKTQKHKKKTINNQ